MGAVPVRASSAVSGRAGGLDTEHTKQQSLFRRHPVAAGIASGVPAVIVVAGLTTWGVGPAVTSSPTASTASEMQTGSEMQKMQMGTPTSSPQAASTAAPRASGDTAAARVAFRATIQSTDGDSWMILTKRRQNSNHHHR
jgi:hypothetical protein